MPTAQKNKGKAIALFLLVAYPAPLIILTAVADKECTAAGIVAEPSSELKRDIQRTDALGSAIDIFIERKKIPGICCFQ
jgi:hypothetical protein